MAEFVNHTFIGLTKFDLGIAKAPEQMLASFCIWREFLRIQNPIICYRIYLSGIEDLNALSSADASPIETHISR